MQVLTKEQKAQVQQCEARIAMLRDYREDLTKEIQRATEQLLELQREVLLIYGVLNEEPRSKT